MSLPESPGDWPEGSGGRYPPAVPATMHPGPVDRSDGGGGRVAARRRRVAVFALLLVIALAGLAVAAVGIAHALLPRQFTAAQRRQISDWEMERRWRVLPAGEIFPASVSYTVPGADLNAGSGLTLQAQRLAISPAEGCGSAFDPAAVRVLSGLGCSTVLRATYLDASGSMVATITVAVLPGSAAANAAYAGLPGTAAGAPGPAHAYAVPGTPAAGFGDAERQLSIDVAAGPYVILSTAGFADDRTLRVASSEYMSREMESLAGGLVRSVQNNLGKTPPEPVCPGAPGC